jgi:hypothetical protein
MKSRGPILVFAFALIPLTLLPVRLCGEIRLQVRSGLPIVDGVFVNGHGPHRFLVDTGTNVNMIGAGLARSIGIAPTYRSELVTPSGLMVIPGSDGIRVELDSLKAVAQQFLLLPLETIRERWPDVEGVLGQAFLSGFDYRIDLRGSRLEFRKQEPPGTRTRFTTVNGRQSVSTSLGELILDSGAVQVVLYGVAPARHSLERTRMLTFSGIQEIGMVFSKPLIIGGRKVWRGDAVAMPGNSEPGVNGLMPASLFRAVYICNSEGYMVLE